MKMLLLFAGLFVSTSIVHAADNAPQVATSVTRASAVFVADVLAADDGAWSQGFSQTRSITVHLRVTEVLRSPKEKPLQTGDFTVQIAQERSPRGHFDQVGGFWSDKQLAAGQRYLVMSYGASSASAAQIFTAPGAAQLLSADDSALSDAKYVLKNYDQPIARQVRSTVALLHETARSRSTIFAEYLGALLAASQGDDARSLSDSLIATHGAVLSDGGRQALLFQIFQQVHAVESASPELMQAFIELNVAYFVDTPDDQQQEFTTLQRAVLFDYEPWLAQQSGTNRPGLRSIGAAQVVRLKNKTAELSSNLQLSAPERQRLQAFLNLYLPS